jgi:putative DeoR family transcriptional regulator (stage III sporulation protein D)
MEMNDYIKERALELGKYIVSAKTTVRDAGKIFGVSKSTVHKDVSERLPKINPAVALQVKDILDYNFEDKHLRGGRATKMHYMQRRQVQIESKNSFGNS